MGRLGNISGKKAVNAFKKLGYQIARQTGSHIILRHQNRPTLTIPNHKELAPGLLRAIISQAGLNISLDQDLVDFVKVYVRENRTIVADVITQFVLGLKRQILQSLF